MTAGTGRDMEQAKPTARQRRGAIISALALAGMALGIYLVVMLKFFVYK